MPPFIRVIRRTGNARVGAPFVAGAGSRRLRKDFVPHVLPPETGNRLKDTTTERTESHEGTKTARKYPGVRDKTWSNRPWKILPASHPVFMVISGHGQAAERAQRI